MSITKKLIVTLEDDVATPSERIFIYKGDVGVDIIIELENFNYKIDSISEKNMINRIEAYFKTPQGIVRQYNDEVDVINGDRIKFSFSKNVINDMQIIGKYELQFHLFDKEDNRITIPSYFFYVKEPLHEDLSDEWAVVGYATVDYSKVQDNDVVLFAMDENGYIKTDWKTGDIITASKLNKIETQLVRVTSNAKELNDKLNLKSDAEHTHSQYTTRIDLENYIGENKDLLKGDKGDQGLPGINGQDGKKGDKGDKGEDGLTTAILVNGQTYTHNNGTITLPNYPTVPTKTSELINDSSFTTESYVENAINNAQLGGGEVDLSRYATKEELDVKVDKIDGKGLSTNDLTNELKANYDIAYTHSQSTHAPINAQKNSDITKTEIEAKLIGNITTHTHNQYLTEHQDISKLATKTELNNKVDKIDGMGLSTNDYTTEEKNKLNGIEEGANNYTHPTTHNATIITQDSTHRFVTDTEKSTWNNKSNFSGNYNDLTNKPTIPTVTNDLTNELKSNYDTAYAHSQSVHAPSNAQKNSDITKGEIEAKLIGNITSHAHSQYLTEHQDISNLALKSELPTKTSDLINDSGYLTSVPTEYVTETELTSKGYATETYVQNKISEASLGNGGNLDDYQTKTDNTLGTTNKTVVGAINEINTALGKYLPFENSYVSDCNSWLTNGYTKTSTSTSNHPSVCTGRDKWGILFFIAENVAQGTGTQMYFPIDGTYKGAIFIRSLTRMNNGGEVGEWKKLATASDIPTVTNDLTNELKANYDTAYTHSQSAHAPSNAQKNSDITKTEIEAKLIGNITTHTHSQYLTEHQDISNLATKDELNTKANSSDIPTSLPANGGNADTIDNFHIWKGTQAQYDAISSKDSNTIYIIVG